MQFIYKRVRTEKQNESFSFLKLCTVCDVRRLLSTEVCVLCLSEALEELQSATGQQRVNLFTLLTLDTAVYYSDMYFVFLC